MNTDKRKNWSESFKKYSEDYQDPNLLPDFIDSEAIEILENEEKEDF